LLFNDSGSEKRIMSITDIAGKLVNRVDITGRLRYSHKEVLMPGVYFISIEEGTQKYTTRLIVY